MQTRAAFLFVLFSVNSAFASGHVCADLFKRVEALAVAPHAAAPKSEIPDWVSDAAAKVRLSEAERNTVYDLLIHQFPVMSHEFLPFAQSLTAITGEGRDTKSTKIFQLFVTSKVEPQKALEFGDSLIDVLTHASEFQGVYHRVKIGSHSYSAEPMNTSFVPMAEKIGAYINESPARREFAKIVLGYEAQLMNERRGRSFVRGTPFPHASELKQALHVSNGAKTDVDFGAYVPVDFSVPLPGSKSANWIEERRIYLSKFLSQAERTKIGLSVGEPTRGINGRIVPFLSLYNLELHPMAEKVLEAHRNQSRVEQTTREAAVKMLEVLTRPGGPFFESRESMSPKTPKGEYVLTILAAHARDLATKLTQSHSHTMTEEHVTRRPLEQKLHLDATLAHLKKLTPEEIRLPDVIASLPAHELENATRIRELTLKTARAMGLTHEETVSTLNTFIETGAIGGGLQATALFAGVHVKNGLRPEDAMTWATRGELKESFTKDLASQDLIYRKTIRMTTWLLTHVQTASKYDAQAQRLLPLLSDQRKQALLAVWYQASMKPMMEMAIKTAPTALTRKLQPIPEMIARRSKVVTIGATVATTAVFHTDLALTAEIVAGGLATFMGGVNAERLPLLSWLSNRFRTNRQRMLQLAKPTKDLALLPAPVEKSARELPPVPEFEFNESFETFTLPLRAEVGKQEFAIDIEVGDTMASLDRIQDNVVPTLRLGMDTFNAQIKRLEQIEKTATEFEQHYADGKTLMNRTKEQADHMETVASRLRYHLRSLQEDLGFTVSAISRQKDLLAFSAKIAREKYPDQASEFEYFLDYAVKSETQLKERTAEKVSSIRKHLFELNKHILFPID